MKYGIASILLFLSMQSNAALIDLNTISPIDATYDLSITTNVEYAGFGPLTQGVLIDLRGLGNRFAGTYYVEAVSHSLSSDGYTYSFRLDRQEGTIVDDNGNTNISLMLLNYEFTTYDFLQNNRLLTRLEFTEKVPEPSAFLLMVLGLAGLGFIHSMHSSNA